MSFYQKVASIDFKNNIELLFALFGILFLTLLTLLFPSPIILSGIFLVIFLSLAIYLGYDYFPLLLFVFLAFSVEIHITGDTRITLPTEFLIPFIGILLFCEIFLRGKIIYRPSVMNYAVLFFYIAIVSSLLITEQPIATIKAIVRDTGYIFAGYYIIPRFVNSENRLKQLLIACLIVHTILVFYGFGTQIVNGLRIYDKIAAPFFIEHCIYAAFITLTFCFIAAFFLDQDYDNTRLVLGVLCCIFALAIGLTFVRAAWLSVALALFYYIFQFRNRKSAVDLLVLMILGFLLVVLVAVTTDLGGMIINRLQTITDFDYVSNFDRLRRWKVAVEMWFDNLFLGVGWGAYPDVYYDYATFTFAYSSEGRMGAHNLYLELLAEIGIVGTITYLILIFIFFRKAIILQYQTNSRFIRVFLIGMQGAMISYLFHAFLNNLGPSDKISLYFWFMLGMIPTIQAMVKDEDNKKSVSEKQNV